MQVSIQHVRVGLVNYITHYIYYRYTTKKKLQTNL